MSIPLPVTRLPVQVWQFLRLFSVDSPALWKTMPQKELDLYELFVHQPDATFFISP